MARGKLVDLFHDMQGDRKLELKEVLRNLVADKLISSEDAKNLFSRNSKEHPLVIVAKAELTSRTAPHRLLALEPLTEWLAGKVGMAYQHIDPLKIDVDRVTGVVPYAYAARHNILPLEVTDEVVTIATAEPYVTEWQQELARSLRRRIQRVLANPIDIKNYLNEFYGLADSVKGAVTIKVSDGLSKLSNLEALVELGRAGKLDANDHHVVNIVNWLFQYAFDQRASDIHLEPRRATSNIRFRIDGVMHLAYQLPTPVMTAVVSRIKAVGRLDVAEKRRPQDGRLKTKRADGNEVELRLSTMPTAFGEKLVMRIFDPEMVVESLEELGLSQREIGLWNSMILNPHGIVLVTGPTGSGKTTTLYSTLRLLARPEVNVCTVEDPIEMVQPALNQMQVQHNINLDFANGVRTLLRQDPDIIMVGEVRDLETAEMAIQASLTGHLVFSTLHTNDTVSSVTRLLDIGVPFYLIKATVLGITAQRLVRTLCKVCKEPVPLDQEAWMSLTKDWKMPPPDQMWHPVGCVECRQTGYRGRTGLYEFLILTPTLRELITAEGNGAVIKAAAIKEGMLPLRISGAQKIAAGITTFEEVFRVVPPSDMF